MTFEGRRVRWTAPPVRGVSPAYRNAVVNGTAVVNGATRPPTSAERRILRDGAEGIVLELLEAGTSIGDRYLLQFGDEDRGDDFEVEVPLPSGVVTFLDQAHDHADHHAADRVPTPSPRTAEQTTAAAVAGETSAPRRYASYWSPRRLFARG